MQFLQTLALVFSSLSLGSLASPTPRAPLRSLSKFSGETTGRIIVTLKDGVSKSNVIPEGLQSTHDLDIINAFAVNSTDEVLDHFLAHPDVVDVEEDGVMHIVTTQTNAPWGLSRLSSTARLANQNTNALTFSYTFDASAGSGVDIFVVDTGVLTTHQQFGGRARFGAVFGPYQARDGNGHGTHVSGTAAGSQFGVAKNANIIGVKVLSDAGSGAVTDIVSGMNFALTSSRSSGRPSIVSMSLGGGASTALDNAVASLTNGGVHVVVAAGNDGADAGTTSPARAPSAITVGATTIADARASFSNFGSVVDVFAPGQNVISAWIDSNTDTNNISGTSMATPHVSGLVAYLIGLRGNMSPAAMSTLVKSLSLKGAISGVPSGTLNDLAHVVQS